MHCPVLVGVTRNDVQLAQNTRQFAAALARANIRPLTDRLSNTPTCGHIAPTCALCARRLVCGDRSICISLPWNTYANGHCFAIATYHSMAMAISTCNQTKAAKPKTSGPLATLDRHSLVSVLGPVVVAGHGHQMANRPFKLPQICRSVLASVH